MKCGMIIKDVKNKYVCCCSCKHNIRIRPDDDIHVICYCDKDMHYIGYVENFENVCDEWEEDTCW